MNLHGARADAQDARDCLACFTGYHLFENFTLAHRQ